MFKKSNSDSLVIVAGETDGGLRSQKLISLSTIITSSPFKETNKRRKRRKKKKRKKEKKKKKKLP